MTTATLATPATPDPAVHSLALVRAMRISLHYLPGSRVEQAEAEIAALEKLAELYAVARDGAREGRR